MEVWTNYYRLRTKNKVIGYAKKIEHTIYFKAYNEFNWHTTALDFDTLDIAVGVKDCHHRHLFLNDVVLYKLNTKPIERRGFVMFEPNQKIFGIVDCETYHFTPFFLNDIALFKQDKLEVVSHLFTNKSNNVINPK